MISIGQEIIDFEIIGVKPKFNNHEENGESAFENIHKGSFQNKWKVIYFYPKDFTFVCPTEIVGSTDNEFCKLAWRREHPDLKSLNQWSFSDTQGTLVDALGIRSEEGVAYRATFIIDPHNIIQHITVNNLNVGRNPSETLRILDALQTDELCPCNRPVGGDTI